MTNEELLKENATLRDEVERLTIQYGDNEPRFVLLSEYHHIKGLLAFATTKYVRLEIENERLRKAGDNLASIVEPPYDHMKQDEYSMWAAEIDALNQWNAAKEVQS